MYKTITSLVLHNSRSLLIATRRTLHVTFENTGLTWILRRHICRVEDKAHRQPPPVNQFPGELPPTEPHLACESEVLSWNQIVVSFYQIMIQVKSSKYCT